MQHGNVNAVKQYNLGCMHVGRVNVVQLCSAYRSVYAFVAALWFRVPPNPAS